MTTTVRVWTGREARALREAYRMTVREFAAHLGVSERTVSKWEAGQETIEPRPEMQSALDTALRRADAEVVTRFQQNVQGGGGLVGGLTDIEVYANRFISAFVGPDAARTLLSARGSKAIAGMLNCRVLRFPGSKPGRVVIYASDCGVVVVHFRSSLRVGRLTELAVTRYAATDADRRRAAELLQDLLDDDRVDALLGPPAWLWWVRHPGWLDRYREAALRLLCMPVVLVDRDDPAGPSPVEWSTEQWHLETAFEHPDVRAFGLRGVGLGYASWAARSYMALNAAQGLAEADVVLGEIMAQMLVCYSRWIYTETTAGRMLTLPEKYGLTFLKVAAEGYLNQGMPIPLAIRSMREAISAALQLPERLKEATGAVGTGVVRDVSRGHIDLSDIGGGTPDPFE